MDFIGVLWVCSVGVHYSDVILAWGHSTTSSFGAAEKDGGRCVCVCVENCLT